MQGSLIQLALITKLHQLLRSLVMLALVSGDGKSNKVKQWHCGAPDSVRWSPLSLLFLSLLSLLRRFVIVVAVTFSFVVAVCRRLCCCCCYFCWCYMLLLLLLLLLPLTSLLLIFHAFVGCCCRCTSTEQKLVRLGWSTPNDLLKHKLNKIVHKNKEPSGPSEDGCHTISC